MSYERNERIRRAAILIASLDEAVAEQMLDAMPRGEAALVLSEVDRLGELDAEELGDVLEEFRTAGRRGKGSEAGVEFTYSAPPGAMMLGNQPAQPAAPTALSPGTHDDAPLMAELLGREHPQTIAAVLSRLEHEEGAAVFAALPADLQGEVLDRLANLELADEGVVQEIESELQQRLEERRARRERTTAAVELARRMVEKTPAARRETLLARLSISPTPVAATSAAADARMERLRQTPRPDVAIQLSPQSTSDAREPHESMTGFEAWAGDGAEETPAAASAPSLEDRSAELESLDDKTLVAALRMADELTVYCALAASSEKFLNRVAAKLPRKQAKSLRQRVRSIGPMRVHDLREAQHLLLDLANQSRGSLAPC